MRKVESLRLGRCPVTAAGWFTDAGHRDRDDVPADSIQTGLVQCQREVKLRGEAEKKPS